MTLARLPFVPQLYEDELLSSWLDRIGLHYGMSRYSLAQSLPEEARDLGNLSNCDASLSALSALTGVSKTNIARALLSNYVEQKSRRQFYPILDDQSTPSFCVYCFGDDWDAGRDVHFRRDWCLTGVGHCHVHGELLQNTSFCCWGIPQPRWGLVDGRIRLYCRGCLLPIDRRHSSDRKRAPRPEEFHQLTYSAEQFLARAITQGERDWPRQLIGCTASEFVKLIEDIAFFLYSPYDRTLPSHLWESPIWQLANVLEFWPLERPVSGYADNFPLDHHHPMTRYARLHASMLVLFPHVAIQPGKTRWLPEPLPSVAWLYRCFTPIGKRMFTRKAQSWPDRIVLPSVAGDLKKYGTFWQTPVRTLVPSLAKRNAMGSERF